MQIGCDNQRYVRLILLCSVLPALCWTPKIGAEESLGAARAPLQRIAASKDLLDINVASFDELKALPGMGQAYARRVIAGRPYSAKSQLSRRGVLPADEYERIRPLIVAHRVKH